MAWQIKRRQRTSWQELPLSNGWTGRLLIKRVGSTVFVKAEALNGASATSTVVAIVPSGFRAEGTVNERGLLHTTASAVSRWWCSGDAFSSPVAVSSPVYGSASWDTLDPTPTGGA
ncbi:MAG: hypothetical protein ACTH6N_04620 [Brachybacterium tyrofermentans]|uniref:hypothetical protein n=1 Tax=Brachybacterium tyrofermentans TaxID=47848 RepID=UPI0018664BFA|nr:hypothetical protein [Brachybacterium tyrofermentans]